MPWKNINQILGLACIDPEFWRALQKDPFAAIQTQGFELTPEEMVMLSKIMTSDLDEFCQGVVDRFAPDNLKPF
ncbi:MAG TPA: Os1348 family NHLP clan protein [Ktedonobacteraceae bacterium]|nr:Os1348 family NHLP clan protein [Ktedonobacteraceae bacterium]